MICVTYSAVDVNRLSTCEQIEHLLWQHCVCCTCFISSGPISCYSTPEHRASTQQCQWTLFPAIALTSLEVSPTVSACFSIILLRLPLGLCYLHIAFPVALIIFCGVRAVLNNTVYKMCKCAASAYTSIEGLDELSLSCHIRSY